MSEYIAPRASQAMLTFDEYTAEVARLSDAMPTFATRVALMRDATFTPAEWEALRPLRIERNAARNV